MFNYETWATVVFLKTSLDFLKSENKKQYQYYKNSLIPVQSPEVLKVMHLNQATQNT